MAKKQIKHPEKDKSDQNQKDKRRKQWRWRRYRVMLYIILTLILTAGMFYFGSQPQKYHVVMGEKSAFDITAPREVENSLKSQENARDAAKKVSPVMVELRQVSLDVVNKAAQFTSQIEDARRGVDQQLISLGINKKDRNSQTKVSAVQSETARKLAADMQAQELTVTQEQALLLLKKPDDTGWPKLRNDYLNLMNQTMQGSITEDTRAVAYALLQERLTSQGTDSDLRDVLLVVSKQLIKPNMVIDEQETRRKQNEASLSKELIVRILKDERIVSQGDIVTADKFAVLQELNLLETGSRFDFRLLAACVAMTLLLAGILVLFMKQFERRLFRQKHQITILCLLVSGVMLSGYFLKEISPFAVPVIVATATAALVMDLRIAIMLNMLLAVPFYFMTGRSDAFFFATLLGGTMAAFLTRREQNRSSLTLAGLFVGVISGGVVLAVGIIDQQSVQANLPQVLSAVLAGIVFMLITLGLLPMWENVFEVLTSIRLLELSNPNHPLMKRLLMEAPGTYHHSLMVGNLAEAAAEATGADSLLVRVGAFYHDVGKLRRPGLFKENQSGENPHDTMEPAMSSMVITSHTQDGLDLARKYKLPHAITDMIAQHHGTTTTGYFLARSIEAGLNPDPEKFRYRGPRPDTREAAIVMLADSVEAAVRSLTVKDEATVASMVKKIIKDKLDDQQLDRCDLSLRDLDTIEKAFMHALGGIFHQRTVYPEIRNEQGSEEDQNGNHH